ncbi:hypothetical protein D3C76_1005960 [compost metagenome]
MCEQGRRLGAVQGPGETLAAAVRILAGHGLAQRPADRRHPDIRWYRLYRGDNAALAVTVAQQVVHLQHQRRGRCQAELAGYGGAVGAADPDTNQVTRPDTDRPGIAKAIAGTGFPGQHGALHQLSRGVTIRPGLATEDAPHNPRRTR